MTEPSAQDALGAIANPTRRSMLKLVWDRERTVNEIADLVGLRQPAASQHLAVLKGAGLVSSRNDGNRRLYTVDFGGIAALKRELEAFGGDALSSLKGAVEARVKKEG